MLKLGVVCLGFQFFFLYQFVVVLRGVGYYIIKSFYNAGNNILLLKVLYIVLYIHKIHLSLDS